MEQQFVPVEEFARAGWSAGDPLKDSINYACGIKPIQGWTNTDYFDGSVLWQFQETGIPVDLISNIVHLDLLRPHPFPDNSFSYAFCEDFIEHIDQKSSLLFLSEVFRTLEPGGIFRISTPSFDGVLKRHFWQANLSHIERGIGEAYDPWGHLHFYTHETLQMAATALGFSRYERCEYGKSRHERLRNLETRTEQIGLNLYAEMTKAI